MRLLAIQHAFFAPTLHGEFDTATNRLRMLICCKGTVSFVNKFDNSSGKPGKQGNFSRRTSLLAGYEKQPIHGPLAGRQPRIRRQKNAPIEVPTGFSSATRRRIQRRPPVFSAWAGSPDTSRGRHLGLFPENLGAESALLSSTTDWG